MKYLGAGLAVAVIAGATLFAAQDKTPIERGRTVYVREKCANCHQIAHEGNSRFPLDGVASRLSAADLRRWLTDTARMENALPRRPAVRMSATKFRISRTDLDALMAYLGTLK